MLIAPGVLGQPARIAPVCPDERLAALHESGHAVFAQMLDDTNGLGFVQISEVEEFVWTGSAGHHRPGAIDQAQDASIGFPSIESTVPYEWEKAAHKAWNLLLVAYAGTAAELVFDNRNITPWAIRRHTSTYTDDQIALSVCENFWPDDVQQDVLNQAAATSAVMLSFPQVHAAVSDLADFLLEHGRNRSDIYQTSVIVRNRIPQNIKPVPFADWAVSLRRPQA